MLSLRPAITLGKDEYGAIVVTLKCVTVDEAQQPLRASDGQIDVCHTEQFRMFESGFGKTYVAGLAFDEADVKPSLVIDREGKRHFHCDAPMEMFGATGQGAQLKLKAGA